MGLRLCAAAALVAVAVCSVPEDLSNFQNEYVCNTDVRRVLPLSVADVQEAVLRHTHVVPVGEGHSWNREFFCAPTASDGASTANLIMTTIRPLMIDVDEEEMSVWASAGVTVWDLMEFLGHYVTPSAPRGYALGATPIYVNQTIGGAVSTGTHGSSLVHGSLSNQVIGLEVVLANGSQMEIHPERDPLIFRAFQVSVGRLGVITDVKMRIIHEKLVERTLETDISGDDFMNRLRNAQERYKLDGSLPKWILHAQAHWIVTDSTFLLYTFEEKEDEADVGDARASEINEAARKFREVLDADVIDVPVMLKRSERGRDVADGVGWSFPSRLTPNLFYADAGNAERALEGTKRFLSSTGSTVLETHRASFSTPMEFGPTSESRVLSDGYEVAVPVDRMADCFQGVIDLLFDEGERSDPGLFGDITIRFVGKEEGLLAASHDGPQMWMSFEDRVYYNQETRSSNLPLKELIAYFVTNHSCAPARLHWGKAGWPDSGCWNGAEAYRDTWCDFGCVVHALDPNDKFIGSAPGIWNWEGAELDVCCTDNGYDRSLGGCDCTVKPLLSPDACPEPPFYTNR